MSKSIPSTTQMIFRQYESLDQIYEGLAPADQRKMDTIFKRIVKYKISLTNAKPLRPIIVFCILMLLEVYKILTSLLHLHYQEIRRLRKAIETAGIDVEEAPAIEEDSATDLELQIP